MKNITTKNLVLGGLFIAMGIVLPFLTAQNQQLGNMFLPMHLPILISGFVCGWPVGLAVGIITPLLRSVMFGMPPFLPIAVSMAFELGAFGFITGILYSKMPKKIVNIYIILVIAILAGRVVSAIANLALLGFGLRDSYNLQIFLAGSFINAWPGIILQIVLIPVLIRALQKSRLMES